MPKPNKIHFEQAYVVRINKRRRKWLVFGILLLVISVPLLTHYGTLWYAVDENRQLADEVNRQINLIEDLQNQVADFEQSTANADLSLEVGRNLLEQMRKDMVASQAQIETLQEQISFYQSLMDPNPEKGGVYIETVDIEPTAFEREYRYNIIVAQKSSSHRRVKGSVNVEFIAELNTDDVQTLALSELTETGKALPLGFKFFQQFDGSVVLPQGFNPASVRVMVQLQGNSSPRLDETYEWPL